VAAAETGRIEGVHHLLHRFIDVADKTQTGIGDDFGPARKAAVGHEVLHDLDGVRITTLIPPTSSKATVSQ
jgi:hypothetical protein